MSELIQNMISELRRGTLMLSVLSQLRERQYGYSLRERLSAQGIEIDQGTLYPLLRRLEEQGLLESQWSLEDTRPRRYYRLNDTGRDILHTLTQEWHALVDVMSRMLPEREDTTYGTR